MKLNKSNSDLHSYLMAYVCCEQFLVCLVFVNLTSCMEWAQSVEINPQANIRDQRRLVGYGICASNVSDTTYINLKSSTLRYPFENSFLYPAKSYYLLHVKLNKLNPFLFFIFRYHLIIHVYTGLKQVCQCVN